MTDLPLRINEDVIDYLRSGLKAGMVLPDSSDSSRETVRGAASAPPPAASPSHSSHTPIAGSRERR